MKRKRTVTVTRDSDPIKRACEYQVTKATNTTDPAVGDYLSESEVSALIRAGVTVNIVPKPSK